MAEGWLWLSMRMATAMPSPASMTPAFSPGPDQDPRALGGQAPQVQPGRLVRAVLAPHDGVQRQLQVVGGAAQDLADGLELVVGQAELRGAAAPRPGDWSGGNASAGGVMMPPR